MKISDGTFSLCDKDIPEKRQSQTTYDTERRNEPRHDKTNRVAYAPSEDSAQPALCV